MAGVKNMDNLTGQKFGKLTVIERDFEKTDASKQAFWWCACDCGEKNFCWKELFKKWSNSFLWISEIKGEEKISKILNNNKIPHIKGYTFNDLKGKRNKLKFDFAIFDSF